ncbi:hypothetical protein KR067_005013, partial [Drosophila pandora]
MTFLQINLHHSKVASAALLLHLAESGADVALIQEPWIHGDRILGLGASDFRLYTADVTGKKRACILAKKNLNTFLLPNFSNEDHVAASIEGPGGHLRICLAYMGHYHLGPPPHSLLRRLVEDSERFVGRCDNATNFVGASRHFAALRHQIESEADELRQYASKKGCVFAFIPPRAPHMGGLWEAGQMFWQRWSREYVLGLQARSKWQREQEDARKGDLVLVAEDNQPPQQWITARVVE